METKNGNRNMVLMNKKETNDAKGGNTNEVETIDSNVLKQSTVDEKEEGESKDDTPVTNQESMLRRQVSVDENEDVVVLEGTDGQSKVTLTIPKTLPTENYRPIPKPPKHHHHGPGLSEFLHRRRASFSPEEEFFLNGLLIDDDPNPAGTVLQAPKVLNEEILCSVPTILGDSVVSNNKDGLKKPPKPRRRSIATLWEAHAAGVPPKSLIRRGSRIHLSQISSDLDPDISKHNEEAAALRRLNSKGSNGGKDSSFQRLSSREGSGCHAKLVSSESNDFESESVASDQEVRHDDLDDRSECSSWGEEDISRDFNPWHVLKDEYAKEFGFDYTERGFPSNGDEDSQQHNTFLILGTSADDKSAQPHVLSPPLMDALINYLPEQLKGENFWLKFSLVRDGALLDTLKRYVRAPKYTILAIETDRGEVFGCFTSEPWRTAPGYFGTAPAFVWKMKHSRRSECFSLFDQAELESEIECYPLTGGKQFAQVCKHDLLAVGGDESRVQDFVDDQSVGSSFAMEGFAIALEDDLLRGTTSPSASFNNPSLCGSGNRSEVFYVAGLEVWTFTPCRDVDSAEKMEMSRYFFEQSSRNNSMRSPSASSRTSSYRSQDMIQSEFYKRVGQDSESEERRETWQYRNMMGGNGRGQKGLGSGSSPRWSR